MKKYLANIIKGDTLFDSKWFPSDDDLLKYESYFVKLLDKFEVELKEWREIDSKHKAPEDEMTLNEWVAQYISFKLRGVKTIHSYEGAYKAAVNFANYIS